MNKLAQLWFGHFGTKESNIKACHTITLSIQNSTVLQPLTTLSVHSIINRGWVIAYILIFHEPLDLKRLVRAFKSELYLYQTSNL